MLAEVLTTKPHLCPPLPSKSHEYHYVVHLGVLLWLGFNQYQSDLSLWWQSWTSLRNLFREIIQYRQSLKIFYLENIPLYAIMFPAIFCFITYENFCWWICCNVAVVSPLESLMADLSRKKLLCGIFCGVVMKRNVNVAMDITWSNPISVFQLYDCFYCKSTDSFYFTYGTHWPVRLVYTQL